MDTPHVVFIGTVNVDETTHAFSPKVLDRANVIEFNDVYLDQALGLGAEPEASDFRLAQGKVPPAWLIPNEELTQVQAAKAQNVESFTGALADVHGILERFDRHFGYRVIKEMSAFAGHALDKIEGDEDEIVRTAFDRQLLQKVMPKLSGGRELEEPLAHLLRYCINEDTGLNIHVEQVLADARERLTASSSALAEPGTELAAGIKYEHSARKLLRMLDRLRFVGFVSALE